MFEVVNGFLKFRVELLARLLVVPEDVALEGNADARHAQPDAHVDEVVRLRGPDCADLLELGQIQIDGPPTDEEAHADHKEIGTEDGSDPDHVVVDVSCHNHHYNQRSEPNDKPKDYDILHLEVEQVGQSNA